MSRALALAALLLSACSEPPPPEPPLQSKEPVSDSQPSAATGLRFRAVGGAPPAVTVEGVGRHIVVANAPVVSDLDDGTRVTAAPGAELWAFAHARSLLLVSGEVQATRIVDAERAASPPVRIVCLAGAIEPNAGAELTLRVEPRAQPLAYRAQLSLTRGSATWVAPDEHAAVKESLLIVGDPLPMPAPGLQWQSLPPGPKAQVERDKRFAMLRHAALGADLDALLEAALTEQQALRQQGHALLAQVSPRRGSSVTEAVGSPRAYQRELVAQAQRREAQAKQLLSAAERSLLRALVLCAGDAPQTCPALRAWRERFAARLAASM